MLDMIPWIPVGVGVAAAILLAFKMGVEVGKDKVRRGGEGHDDD